MNTIILFGAVQGFILCVYFLFLKNENKTASRYFILFLFSLSLFNLLYSFLLMDIKEFLGIPLTSIPIPYKYLIGVGFYFYIRAQLVIPNNKITPRDYLLFLPALIYGTLRLYWYIKMHSGNDQSIFYRVYQTGFFTYNEFAYLSFNIILILASISFLRKNQHNIKGLNKAQKNWKWLLRFTYFFLVFTIINLIHQIVSVATLSQDNPHLYLLLLVLNTVYIYWVGIESLTKSSYLFNVFTSADIIDSHQEWSPQLKEKLNTCIYENEVFTHKNLKKSQLAALINVSESELSLFIHENYSMTFTEYINQFRVEKVKELLASPTHNQFTLVAIAEEAGFNSKSSFNAVFKRHTGITPSKYKALRNT